MFGLIQQYFESNSIASTFETLTKIFYIQYSRFAFLHKGALPVLQSGLCALIITTKKP